MDINDDEMTDRLDYLSDRHADFFEWLEVLWNMPELPEDWELFVTEPSPAEIEQMSLAADELVRQIFGDL